MATASPIRNVIVMIADGAGFNTLQSTRYYLQGLADGDPRAGAAGRTLVADGPTFTATAQSTYPLDTRTTPVPGEGGTAQNPNTVYNPARNYDFTRVAGTDPNGQPRAFAGYDWNRDTAPDSGNTASAIATGEKTYNNAIDVDGNGLELFTIAQRPSRSARAPASSPRCSSATPPRPRSAAPMTSHAQTRTTSRSRCSARACST
jgi:alkaline phosphatase